jgi:hypothetical protein
MRNTIINCGGEVHFQTKMTRLIIRGMRNVEGGMRIPANAEDVRVIGVEAENISHSTLHTPHSTTETW